MPPSPHLALNVCHLGILFWKLGGMLHHLFELLAAWWRGAGSTGGMVRRIPHACGQPVSPLARCRILPSNPTHPNVGDKLNSLAAAALSAYLAVNSVAILSRKAEGMARP
jgi:hypothetical protein